MKILMLNNEFPPLGGGTGTVNKELFEKFKFYEDLKIDLITSSLGKTKEFEQFSENIRIFKYPVNNQNIHHSSNLELIKYIFKSFFAALKLHKTEKYDFCFAWSTVPAGFVAYILHKIKKLPFIVRVGGPDIPGFEERYKNLYRIISPIIKRIWKNANLIVAKCKLEQTMIQNINKNLKIEIIYNGVDSEKFFPINNKILETDLKIICPARLIKRKGQDLLIKAIANLKNENINYKVFMIGDGDEKQNYLDLTKKLLVNQNIEFLEYIARDEMQKYYQNSDLFVLPSYNEGMSNSMLEAMASGLVPIVTNVGGTEELIDSENGFIFKIGDAEDLTKILKHIYLNKNKIIELQKNARRKAEQNSWKNIADIYYQLFKEKKF